MTEGRLNECSSQPFSPQVGVESCPGTMTSELLSQSQFRVRVTGSGRTRGYACIERSKTEGIKQRGGRGGKGGGRCHKGNATAHSLEPPHTNPTPPTET
eukprot:365826-Chlamydomonas_euryale.AAC.4